MTHSLTVETMQEYRTPSRFGGQPRPIFPHLHRPQKRFFFARWLFPVTGARPFDQTKPQSKGCHEVYSWRRTGSGAL